MGRCGGIVVVQNTSSQVLIYPKKLLYSTCWKFYWVLFNQLTSDTKLAFVKAPLICQYIIQVQAQVISLQSGQKKSDLSFSGRSLSHWTHPATDPESLGPQHLRVYLSIKARNLCLSVCVCVCVCVCVPQISLQIRITLTWDLQHGCCVVEWCATLHLFGLQWYC